MKAHAAFQLFATQNPAGSYAGRKKLSRAFLNRFLIIRCEPPPISELGKIVESRCRVAPSAAAVMVEVMVELKSRRALSGIFSSSSGLMTMRYVFPYPPTAKLSIEARFHRFQGPVPLGQPSSTLRQRRRRLERHRCRARLLPTWLPVSELARRADGGGCPREVPEADNRSSQAVRPRFPTHAARSQRGSGSQWNRAHSFNVPHANPLLRGLEMQRADSLRWGHWMREDHNSASHGKLAFPWSRVK